MIASSIGQGQSNFFKWRQVLDDGVKDLVRQHLDSTPDALSLPCMILTEVEPWLCPFDLFRTYCTVFSLAKAEHVKWGVDGMMTAEGWCVYGCFRDRDRAGSV